MGYSFTSFTGGRGNNGNNNNNNNAPKNPTQGQVKYYLDLCRQKGVTPVNYMRMTYEELAKVIEELRLYIPVSENQLKMIREKIESLRGMGIEIKEPDYSKLTGGRGGSASTLIEQLLQKERENSDKMLPTEQQLQFIVGMYLCPDVPFENFDIKRRVELEGGKWRKFTPDEFAEEVRLHMTKRDASAFIDMHRGVYHEWKSTRITQSQMEYIRELEKRMADIHTPRITEWYVSMSGTLEMQTTKKVGDNGKYWAPKGYEGMSDFDLLQFSTDDASNYISILKSELGRKELTAYRDVSDNSQTLEFMREKKNKKENPMDVLVDLVFKMDAIAGYENDIAHDAVTPLLMLDGEDDEEVQEAKRQIREYMLYLVESGSITFDGLTQLCSDSEVAQKILLGL